MPKRVDVLTKPLLLGSQDIEPGTQRLVSSDGRILAETAVVELESDDDSERIDWF